jgi:recombination protein RecA
MAKGQLERFLQSERKRLGNDGSIQTLSQASSEISGYYSTGCPTLDICLTGKIGNGFPVGRIVELFGEEHVGKTTLGLMLIKGVQRLKKHHIMIIDSESTLEASRAKALGVDTDDTMYFEDEYIENILEHIHRTVVKLRDVPTIIMWDTVAASPSKREALGGYKIGEAPIADHARKIAEGLRRIAKPLARSKTLLLLCNQEKVGGIGVRFARERDLSATAGGRSVKFYAQMRLALREARKSYSQVGSKKMQTGFEANAILVKNKGGISPTKCTLVFHRQNDGRFHNALSALRTLVQWNGAKKGTKGVTFNGKAYSDAQFCRMYATDKEFKATAHAALTDAFNTFYAQGTQEDIDGNSEVTEED